MSAEPSREPEQTSAPAPRGGFALFRSFRHRNYRLFYSGQSVSLVGTWMQRTAMGWLVYRTGNSAFLLGVIGFTDQIPAFFLAPLAGVLVDRWNRHRLLVLTQILSLIQAGILTALVLANRVEVWHLIALSLFLGVINAFDMPTRQAFVIEMVEDKADLSNAIALNSSMFHMARMAGPSIAGLVIAAAGEGICFLLNAASYIPILASLFLMRLHGPRPRVKTPVFSGMKEGFRYAFGFPPIRALLLLLSLTSLVGFPYIVLMPVFAKDIFHGGPDTLGFFMGATGAGALVGAISLAARKSVLGLGKLIVIASSLFGIGLIGFSHAPSIPVSMALLLIAGFGMIVQIASSNTILQTLVEDDKRGRVMSIYTTALVGVAPIGSLSMGSLASHIGAPNAIAIGGFFCIVGSVLFAWKLPSLRKFVRPIYQDLGILRRE